MGVDVSAVSGFSVKIPGLEDILKESRFSDLEELLDDKGIVYCHVGSQYTGKVKVIPIYEPSSAVGLEAELQEWVNEINDALGVKLTLKDVYFVSDTYWY